MEENKNNNEQYNGWLIYPDKIEKAIATFTAESSKELEKQAKNYIVNNLLFDPVPHLMTRTPIRDNAVKRLELIIDKELTKTIGNYNKDSKFDKDIIVEYSMPFKIENDSKI